MSVSSAWFRSEKFDPALPRKLTGLFSNLKKWKEREVREAIKLEFLYERDKHRSKSNRNYHMPRWVLEDYQWLEQDYASPTRNIIKSRVDMVASLLLSSQPAIEIRASGAGYEEQRIARSREAALEGTMNTDLAKEQLRLVGRDGLVTNLGASMPIVRGNQVHFLRLRLDQLYWDPFDARHGQPKSMHMVEFIDRDDFIGWYESLDAEAMGIRGATEIRRRIKKMQPVARNRETDVEAPYDWELSVMSITDSTERLRVVHSWRVSDSALNEKGGRYICTVYGRGDHSVVAIDRPYPRTTLPIVTWSPYPAQEGLIGIGIAAGLVDVQRALDYSMRRLQNRLEKMGWNKIAAGMNINEEALENYLAEEITVVRLPGVDAPFPLPTDALSQHDLAWVETLVSWSAADQGINQILAQGGSSRGANASGIAMFEEADRQIDRISDIYEAWQFFRLRLAEETLNAIEDAVRMDESFATSYRDIDGDLIKYDWADASLPNGSFSLAVEEAGEWGRTRAGRMARIFEAVKLGMLDPSTGSAAAQDSPDVRRLNRLANAKRRKIERDVAILIDPKGKHDTVVPTEDDDLALSVKITSDMISDAGASGAKPETIERLREYRRQAEGILQKIEAEARMSQVQSAAATLGEQTAMDQATQMQADEMLASVGSPM